MIENVILFAKTTDFLDIEGFFRTASFMIDKTIFGLIPKVFNLIMQIARETIFSTMELENFANNIYAIIGVFMLFRLAFVLLNAIIDPEKLTDSKQGAGKMLMKLIISLVLIVAIPWGFAQAFNLQNVILDKGILSKIMLGSNTTDGTPSSTPMLSCAYVPVDSNHEKVSGKNLRIEIYRSLNIRYLHYSDNMSDVAYNVVQKIPLQDFKQSAYYFCPSHIEESNNVSSGIVNPEYNFSLTEATKGTNYEYVGYDLQTDNVYTYNYSFSDQGNGTVNGMKQGKTIAKTILQSFIYCNPQVDTNTTEVNCSSSDLMGYFDESFNTDNNDEPTFDTLSSVLNNEAYTGTQINYIYKYNIIVSTIAGGFVLFMLVMFAFEVGLRVVKLGFLQLMAPVAVIGYLDPKGEFFNKWLKMTISVYVSLFIRLIAIYFMTYLITVLSTKIELPNLTRVFILFGALMFAKEAPKLLGNLFGLDEGSLGSFGNPFKRMLGGGALMGAAGLAMSAAGKGASTLGGAGLGTARAAMKNNHGRSVKDIFNPKNIGSNAKALGRGAAVGAKSGFNSMKLSPKATLGSTLKGVGGGAVAGFKGADKDERLKSITGDNYDNYADKVNKGIYDKYGDKEGDSVAEKERKAAIRDKKVVKNRLLPDKSLIEANRNKNLAKDQVLAAQKAQKFAELQYQKEPNAENQKIYEAANKSLKEAEKVKETLDANYDSMAKDPKHAKAAANLAAYERTTKNEKAKVLVDAAQQTMTATREATATEQSNKAWAEKMAPYKDDLAIMDEGFRRQNSSSTTSPANAPITEAPTTYHQQFGSTRPETRDDRKDPALWGTQTAEAPIETPIEIRPETRDDRKDPALWGTQTAEAPIETPIEIRPETRDDRKDATLWERPITHERVNGRIEPKMMGRTTTTYDSSAASTESAPTSGKMTRAEADRIMSEPSTEPTLMDEAKEKVVNIVDKVSNAVHEYVNDNKEIKRTSNNIKAAVKANKIDSNDDDYLHDDDSFGE